MSVLMFLPTTSGVMFLGSKPLKKSPAIEPPKIHASTSRIPASITNAVMIIAFLLRFFPMSFFRERDHLRSFNAFAVYLTVLDPGAIRLYHDVFPAEAVFRDI